MNLSIHKDSNYFIESIVNLFNILSRHLFIAFGVSMLGSLVLAGDGPAGPPGSKGPVIGCFDPYVIKEDKVF